jgi:hypothetical protein
LSGANYALLTPGAATMARIDAGRAAQVGGFVFRYLWARHRCMGADAPPTPRRLTILVAQGEREFDGIEVEPYKEPPIRRDIKHPDFFRAIVLLDDRAMPALVFSRQWRAYVHHSAPIPRAKGRRRR